MTIYDPLSKKKTPPNLKTTFFSFFSFFKTEFMSHILKTILQKLNFDLPHLLNQPQYLIHYFDEILRFDKVLREVECYRPRRNFNGKEWGGCISIFLENSQVFNQWVQVEVESKVLLLSPLLSPLFFSFH